MQKWIEEGGGWAVNNRSVLGSQQYSIRAIGTFSRKIIRVCFVLLYEK